LKTILVLGATGFIGSNLVDFFIQEGYNVIGVGRQKNVSIFKNFSYRSITLPSDEFYDILKTNKIDFCIFAAGSSSVNYSFDSPLSDFRDTAYVTAFVLDAIRNYSLDTRFIYISSAAVYGFQDKLPISEQAKISPISPYGYHKYIGEILCAEYAAIYGIKTKIARVFSAYGSGLKKQVLWEICNQAFNKRHVILKGTGNETRDLLNVSDIAIAISKLLDEESWRGDIFNIASGKEISIRSLCELIMDNLPFEVKLQFDGTIHEGNPTNWEADISKLLALNFIPKIDIEIGIRNYVEWYIGNR